MPNPPALAYGCFYHVYNRGNNGEVLFQEARNYRFFFERYAAYIEPVAMTYAYCLLGNHFHLVLRTRTPAEQRAWAAAQPDADMAAFEILSPSHQFRRLFGAYAQAINKAYGRHGSLFEHPFHRIPVTSVAYLVRLIVYVHCNAQHHGFVDDFRDWPYSSFATLLSSQPTRLQREIVLSWFGGSEAFVRQHAEAEGFRDIAPLVLE